MQKIISIGFISAMSIGAASAVLFGSGTASAAPSVVGMKYSDAQEQIENAGGRAVVAARVGDKLDLGDCIVTNIWDSSFLRISQADESEMFVALNCAGEYATATNPGASVANPLGRAAKSKAEEEAEKQELSELESPVTPDN
ncbi:hypothetical protein [Mycolicibacterium novocastrense]|uniref:Uncharacterized protein n=1 Tax=Mycolicibacterium novocastrense TaxID=59813 RepID=A0ABQ0KQX1_MYCNV|nr:hypothetical protein [Mycolicibacterium novocastrense]GAT12035.1 uncharacterized protein RMCN_5168 [Mycolicibacterium novocastrense]